MEIKAATIDDLHALAELFDAYRVFYKKESDIEQAKQFLKARLEKNESTIFVVFSEGIMTGFIQLYPIFSSTRMKKSWLLNDLFVHEKFRGKRFSIALIERAKQLCIDSDASGFMLETAKTNDIGNRLYHRAGLQLDSDHNFFTWDVD